MVYKMEIYAMQYSFIKKMTKRTSEDKRDNKHE